MTTVVKIAFKMRLKPGFEEEYKRRHDRIWPELAQALKKGGISDYSIFLDQESLTLFAVQNLAADKTADQLSKTEIVRRWWDFMADIMEVTPDKAPVCVPLKQVFHLE